MMKATVNAKRPFNFKVNSSSEKIQIRQGDTIELNTTYEANERYKNATIMYAVTDADITKTEGNKFTGLEVGTTKLKLATKEFGRSKELDVTVIPHYSDDPNKDSNGDINVMSAVGTIKVVTDGMYRDINTTEKISTNFYKVVVKNITDNSSISLINAKETTDRDSIVILSSISIAIRTYQENVDLQICDSIINDVHLEVATGDIINANSNVEFYNVEITNNILDDGEIIEVRGDSNKLT